VEVRFIKADGFSQKRKKKIPQGFSQIRLKPRGIFFFEIWLKPNGDSTPTST
jgi:hypothetical protein